MEVVSQVSTELLPLCYKCKINKSAVIVRGLNSCLLCFSSLVESTFKRALRLKCRVFRNDHVILCLSGGTSSLCLLQLLFKCKGRNNIGSKLNPGQPLGIHFSAAVFVDLFQLFTDSIPNARQFNFSESILSSNDGLGKINSQGFQYIQKLNEITAALNILLIIVDPVKFAFHYNDSHVTQDAEDTNNGNLCKNNDKLTNSSFKKDLQQLLSSVKNMSVLEDILTIITERALVGHFLKTNSQIDPINNASKRTTYLLGETGSRIASKSLQLLCKGGGVQLPSAAQYLDERFFTSKCNLVFGRPLKKVTAEEIESYSNTVLNPLSFSLHDSRPPYREDVNVLIDNFISTLQTNNFQTVFIATETLEKLQTPAVQKEMQNSEMRPESEQDSSLSCLPAKFLFGRCRCCLGPMESLESKKAVCCWSHIQIEILNRVFSRNPSFIDANTILDDVLQTLCLRCVRIAATNQAVARIVHLLVDSSSEFNIFFP